MKAEGLLAHYARIADTPDAITRLRRFVLDLAVRGKLVEQDRRDEPSSELLRQLASAREGRKASVSRNGTTRVRAPSWIPAHWAWLPLCEIGAISGGMTPSMSRSDFWSGDIPWFSPKDIKSDEVSDSELKITTLGLAETRLVRYPAGSLFMVARSGILKRTFPVAINRVPAAANQDLKVLVPFVSGMERYLQIMFRGLTDFILSDLVKTGTTVQSLKYAEFEQQAFPLPPLSEQRRIVAKVDELMTLCDRLEVARAQREITRDRLAVASLGRLNAPDPDTFPTDARFALDALLSLTTRPDQIKQLRQTILNLAACGKLVPNDPNDEPVSKLIARVSAERSAYAEAHRIAPMRSAPIGKVPFPAPKSWKWFRICEVFNVITDGDHQPPPRADHGVAFLTIGNVSTGSIEFAGCRLVPDHYFRALSPYRTPSQGDILYTVVGASYGRPVVVDTAREFCVQRHIAILKPSSAMDTKYLFYLLSSPLIYDQASQSTTGSAQPTIALKPLRNFLAPIPPIAEQRRIVAKVDELMALCSQLETSLTAGETARHRLLDALLHEALEPAVAPRKEHSRAAVSGYVVSRLASKRNFGRTAHMKYLYLAEARLGLDLGGHYMREAAGPLDAGIYDLERQAEAAGWYTHSSETLSSGNEKVSYKPGNALKAIANEGIAVLGRSHPEMDRLIDLMGGLKTEPVEIIATLFAVWNDALLDGQTPDDNWIIKEVREHWHVSKQRFTPADLNKWLGWMRQNDVVPLGHPPRTMQQTTMEF